MNEKNEKFKKFVEDKNKISISKKLNSKIKKFIFLNNKSFTYAFIDLMNNTFFHFLDTVKVRSQAFSLKDDVSNYKKNQVKGKTTLPGVFPAAVGSFISGYLFIYTNNIIIANLFNKKKKSYFYDFNWKVKFLISYLISDFFKITAFFTFETRKQRFQLLHDKKDMKLNDLSRYMIRAYPVILTREMIFRVITLGSYFKFCQPEHKPKLRYDIEEVRELIKIAEKEGIKLDFYYFVDYSNMTIRSKDVLFSINVIFSTFLATLITHPFDVVNTKILTQTRLKYKGFFQASKLIIAEEGLNSLFTNGLFMRFLFNVLSVSMASYVFMTLNMKIIQGSK